MQQADMSISTYIYRNIHTKKSRYILVYSYKCAYRLVHITIYVYSCKIYTYIYIHIYICIYTFTGTFILRLSQTLTAPSVPPERKAKGMLLLKQTHRGAARGPCGSCALPIHPKLLLVLLLVLFLLLSGETRRSQRERKPPVLPPVCSIEGMRLLLWAVNTCEKEPLSHQASFHSPCTLFIYLFIKLFIYWSYIFRSYFFPNPIGRLISNKSAKDWQEHRL